eukprot:1150776-Pelagomonas_calceolata.AAC.1
MRAPCEKAVHVLRAPCEKAVHVLRAPCEKAVNVLRAPCEKAVNVLRVPCEKAGSSQGSPPFQSTASNSSFNAFQGQHDTSGSREHHLSLATSTRVRAKR